MFNQMTPYVCVWSEESDTMQAIYSGKQYMVVKVSCGPMKPRETKGGAVASHHMNSLPLSYANVTAKG